MTQEEKNQIIEKFKEWFKSRIIANHRKATIKLVNVKEFNINPFTLYYLSNYLEGNSDSTSLAKALLYPRILGTSITTIWGTGIQQFLTEVMSGYGSSTSGIDIEFVDQIDGRRKYCQLKSGPNALNNDDVTTIDNHFKGIRNLAITNSLDIGFSDLVFSLVYGEDKEVNSFIKKLQAKNIVVYVGQTFWHRFTGDEHFYFDLIKAAGEVANDVDMKNVVGDVIEALSESIEDRFSELYDNE